MQFREMIKVIEENIGRKDFSDLDIKIKLIKTKSKIWKEVAKVLINNSIRGYFGSNNGFTDFGDTGYALGPDIPGVGNDTLDKRRRDLLRHILKLIRTEKVLKGLSDSARQTWSDILESKQQFDVKCIRGPYWLPDEDPEADEHFGYECTLNGKRIIVGEEPQDGFRYIHEWDGDAYRQYKQYRNEIVSLLGKAIKLHELKKGLKGTAGDTWSDILESVQRNNIKVIKGPYMHIWRDPQYDTKEYAENCYDVILDGYEAIFTLDTNWLVTMKEYRKWFEEFWSKKTEQERKEYIQAIKKAIEIFNMKKGLKGSAKETWNDIL